MSRHLPFGVQVVVASHPQVDSLSTLPIQSMSFIAVHLVVNLTSTPTAGASVVYEKGREEDALQAKTEIEIEAEYTDVSSCQSLLSR